MPWLPWLLVGCSAAPPAGAGAVPLAATDAPSTPEPEAIEPSEVGTRLADLDPERWSLGRGSASDLVVAYRTESGSLPRNVETSIEVRLFLGDVPLEDARLAVRGWMPDHGHGLVQLPHVESLGGGHFLVSHLLLHMRGHWQLVFDVSAGTLRDGVRFELEL